MSIKIKLLIWLLAVPTLAALVGVIGQLHREAQWSRVMASAARMNGLPAPAGPSLTEICTDPMLALPSCIDLTTSKVIFVTSSVTVVLGLALFGGLFTLKRRAAGGRSRLLRAFRPALSITIGLVGVLLVLNVALLAMVISVLAEGRWAGRLWLVGGVAVVASISSLVRLGRVVLSLRHVPISEVRGRRLRQSESPDLHRLIAEVAGRVGTAPPRHLIVGLMSNFFATQTAVKCTGASEIFTGRTLFISLPLCRVLRVDELASVIGHELGHFRGRDTEFSETIEPIYRGAVGSLTALIQDVNRSGVHLLVLRPALYAFEVFLDAFHEAEGAIRRDREYAADDAAVMASSVEAAAAALVKAHAFSPVWEDLDEQARHLAKSAQRVDNLSTLFAERVAARSARHDPFAYLLDQHVVRPSDSHPPLGARLANIGVTLEEVRDRALDVTPADAASGLVTDLESIERKQSAALQDLYITMAGNAGAERGRVRAWGGALVFRQVVVLAGFALAFGITFFEAKFFSRPWLRLSSTPAEVQKTPPLPVMPDVPDRVALLALLRDRQFDALERELADAVRRSRQSPRDEIIASTAFRTFWIADRSIMPLLDEWVGRYDSPFAHLARARHSAALGWAARGTGWGSETSAAQFAAMGQHHANARSDLQEALKRDPALIETHAELIQLARSDRLDQCEAFGALGLRAAPASYRLREVILQCLEPRWGGSLERMRAFAIVSQHYARENPRLSALLGYVEMEIGRTLESSDRHAEAIASYTAALSHGPDGTFYDRRATSYRQAGDYERALADTDAALTLYPQSPELLTDRARSLDKLGRLAEAITASTLAARVDPSDQDARKWMEYLRMRDVVRGHDLAKNGRTADASQAFDTAIQADPTNVEAFYWRGRAFLKSGDMARARDDFKRAVAVDPTHFESYRSLDYLLALEGRWDEIIAMWTEYLARKPHDGAAYLERAGAWRRKGDMTQAYADVRRACELKNERACTIARSLPAQSRTSS